MADLYAKYTCTYCQEDITGLRVKCVECQYFDLCLQCFSAGAEIGQHKNDHSYQFMDSGTISIFNGSRGNWTAREHLRLLDAIEQFGFGNWEDISKHIETRTPEEAKEQYIARYLEGNIGKYTWPPRQRRSSSSSSTSECYTPNLTDQTTSPDHGPLSPDLTSKLPPLDITPEEAQQLGYMPQRDDFERDYNHEAESLVSSLFLNPAEDDDLDIALKLAHVDMYTNNLRERARRKRVVRDYQLVSNFFLSSRKGENSSVNSVSGSNKGIKKRQTKEEKDFRERMRIFAQFYTAQEHEQFLTNLEKERDLRLRLSELYRYRENGITRHEECAHFEQVMAVQNSNEIVNSDHWMDKKSGSSGPTSSTPIHRHTSKKRDEEKSCSFIARKFTTKASSTSNSIGESAQNNNSSGASGFSIANNSNSNSSNNSNSYSNQNRTTTPVNQLGAGAAELDGVSPAPAGHHHQSGSSLLAKQKSSVHNGGVNQQTTCTKSIKNLDLQTNSLDLEAAAHLLTQQEKILCLQLGLKPTQYLTQKTLLLQEYLSGGSGGRRSNFMAHSEPENKILHYLVSNGWIAAAT